MVRRVLAALVLLLSVATAPAQPPAQAQQNEGWAHKLFVSDDKKPVTGHDFGTVPLGAQLTKSFKITNIYDVPLQIFVKTSCECVTATVSKPILNKLDSCTLDIAMDGRRFNGAKSVNVHVTVHHPSYQSTATLTISANSRIDVNLVPGSVAFGLVPRGQTPRKFIDVNYSGGLDWHITAVPNSDLFEISLVQKKRAPREIGYQLSLTLKPDAPAGTHKQNLSLQTDDPSNPTILVPFEVSVQAPLLASPSVVKFSPKVGNEVTANVKIQATSRAFKITSIEGLGDGLELARPTSTDANMVQYLALKFSGTQPGPVSRKLTVKTDGDEDMTAIVTVEANVQQ